MAYNKSQKLKDNIAAIKTVLQLNKEGRQANDDERVVLRKYSGFGGLKFILNPANSDDDFQYWKSSEKQYFLPVRELYAIIHDYAADVREEQELLASIKRSVMTAFYTPTPVINAIAAVMKESCVEVKSMLDPSAGIGKFGDAFKSEFSDLKVTAFEKDLLTGKILQALNPDDEVVIDGFETIQPEQQGQFDVVTSNIPFGDISVFDPEYKNSDNPVYRSSTSAIHNYFFLKALDQVREGGFVAFITSRGFMDSPSNNALRVELMKNAELVGAFRLPDGMFRDEAGTDVGSDLVVLQKHLGFDMSLDPFSQAFCEVEKGFEAMSGEDYTDITLNTHWWQSMLAPDSESIIATKEERGTDPYGKPTLVFTHDGGIDAVAEQLRDYFSRDLTTEYLDYYKAHAPKLEVEQSVEQPKVQSQPQVVAPSQEQVHSAPVQLDLFALWDAQGEDAFVQNTEADKAAEQARQDAERKRMEPRPFNGSVLSFYRDGVVVEDPDTKQLGTLSSQRFPSSVIFTPVDLNLDQTGRMRQYIMIRDAYHELYNTEAETRTEQKDLRDELNRHYDNFYLKYGRLNERKNTKLFLMDSLGRDTLCLENAVERDFVKADIFERPVSFINYDITEVDTPEDALSASLNRFGAVDLEYMSSISNHSEDELVDLLKGQIYYMPDGHYEISTKALSGNIYFKLDYLNNALSFIEETAENQKVLDALHETKAALEQVIPQQIPFDDIGLQFGERWIPTEYYEEYVSKLFDTDVHISYAEHVDEYSLNAKNRYNLKIREEFCVRGEYKDYDGMNLLNHAFHNTTPDIQKCIGYDEHGEDRKGPDMEKIQLASTKIDEIRDGFIEYLTNLPKEKRDELQNLYNKKFNCFVKAQYDGSHQTFPGIDMKSLASPRFNVNNIYQSQKDCVWMILQNGGGICDHEVGTGKTLIMCMAAHEMHRLGIANKPMIIALKANVAEIAATYQAAFPDDKILYASEKDFSPANRLDFFNRIKNNDYACVIMSHDQFGKIPQSMEIQEQILWDEIRDVEEALEVYRQQGGQVSSRMLSGLEKRKENLTAKVRNLQYTMSQRKDDFVDFGNMGIDHIFVDESHQFKNLMFTTRHNRVSGLGNPAGSQKALNLLYAIRTIQGRTGKDLGATFLSGTTISNSLTELYLLFKYLRPNAMAAQGIHSFDAWAAVYAKKTSDYEFSVTNSVVQRERFRYFVKVPELATFYNEITDYRTGEDVGLDRPNMNVILHTIKPTADQQDFNERLVEFAKSGKGELIYYDKEVDTKSKMLIATTASRKASLDMRLIAQEVFGDDPDNKASHCARLVSEYYHKFDEQKGTQFVFSDLSTWKSGEWNVFQEIKDKLVNDYGIPANEIRFIQEANNEKQRKELIQGMNDGTIRVLFGSTATLGTGVNAQKRAVAVHHIDIPWRPSDLEQRDGRARRTGNEVAKLYANNNVDVIIYAVERSLDSYKFNLLQNKQLFIIQLKTNSLGTRVIDEGAMDEENGMNFAEYVAILSGNDDLLQKARLEKKVLALESERKTFMKARRDTEWRLGVAKEKFDKHTVIIQNMSEDYDRFSSVVKRSDDGTALPGLTMKDIPEYNEDGTYNVEGMGAKLQDAGRTMGNHNVQIGTVYGFPLMVDTIYMYDEKSKQEVYAGNKFYVKGHYLYEHNNGHLAMSKDNRLGAVRFGVQALEKIPSVIEQYQKKNEQLEKDIAEYGRIAGKAWGKEDELKSLKHELEDLDKRIQESLDETTKSLPKQEEPVYKISKEGKYHRVSFPREALAFVSLAEMREMADTGGWRNRGYVRTGHWVGDHMVSDKEVEAEFSFRQKAEEFIKDVIQLNNSRKDDSNWLAEKAKEDTHGYLIHQDNEVIYFARKRLAELNGEDYRMDLPSDVRSDLFVVANTEGYHTRSYSSPKNKVAEARHILTDYGYDWRTNLSLEEVQDYVDLYTQASLQELTRKVNVDLLQRQHLFDDDEMKLLSDEEKTLLDTFVENARLRRYNESDRREDFERLAIYYDYLHDELLDRAEKAEVVDVEVTDTEAESVQSLQQEQSEQDVNVLAYDEATNTWSGIPKGMDVICSGEPDRIREIYGYTDNNDIDLVYYKARDPESSYAFVRVWVDDHQAETPAKIVVQLEREDYHVGLHGERGHYIDVETWDDAVKLEQHIREIEQQLHTPVKDDKTLQVYAVDTYENDRFGGDLKHRANAVLEHDNDETRQNAFSFLDRMITNMDENDVRRMVFVPVPFNDEQQTDLLNKFVWSMYMQFHHRSLSKYQSIQVMDTLKKDGDKYSLDSYVPGVGYQNVFVLVDINMNDGHRMLNARQAFPEDWDVRGMVMTYDPDLVNNQITVVTSKELQELSDKTYEEQKAATKQGYEAALENLNSTWQSHMLFEEYQEAQRLLNGSWNALFGKENIRQQLLERYQIDWESGNRVQLVNERDVRFYHQLLQNHYPEAGVNIINAMEEIAYTIAKNIDEHSKLPDWNTRDSVLAKIRTELKRELRSGNYPDDKIAAVVDDVMKHIAPVQQKSDDNTVTVKQVDVMGLMSALSTKGEAKLSDFATPVNPNQSFIRMQVVEHPSSLTAEEKSMVNQIVSDIATGNHLLGRPRPEGYWDFAGEWKVAVKTLRDNNVLSQRQRDILVEHANNLYGGVSELAEDLDIDVNIVRNALGVTETNKVSEHRIFESYPVIHEDDGWYVNSNSGYGLTKEYVKQLAKIYNGEMVERDSQSLLKFNTEEEAKSFVGNVEMLNERYTNSLRDGIIEKMRKAGINVNTDWREGERILARENGDIRMMAQARIQSLKETEKFIEESLKGKHRGQRVEVQIPVATQNKIRKAIGRDFDSHNIYANGIIHGKINHGIGGEKLDVKSIPLSDEDFKLAPHIMVAPDRVVPGSIGTDGRESIRFEKDLSNGIVLVVEKEQKNSPNDMDTITMWATMSSLGADARLLERPLHTTSQPVDVANGTNVSEVANTRTVIQSFDAAKIRKDAEIAIENDEKLRFLHQKISEQRILGYSQQEIEQKIGSRLTTRNYEDIRKINPFVGFLWSDKVPEFADFREVFEKPSFDDYYIATKAEFENVGSRLGQMGSFVEAGHENQRIWAEMVASGKYEHQKSPRSHSEYLLDHETGDIYRFSDHWGRVSSCQWDIDKQFGTEDFSLYEIGKCNINDFKPNYFVKRTHNPAYDAPYADALARTISNYETLLNSNVEITDAARKRVEQTLEGYRKLQSLHTKDNYRESRYGVRMMVVPDIVTPIFVSNAMLALQKVHQEKATPEQWLKMLQKNGGIKSGEDRWTGLSQWLNENPSKVLTKAEVMAYLNENMIDVQEVHYVENLTPETNQKLRELNNEFHELILEGEEHTNSIYPSDWVDYAYEEMVSRYGDDFRDGFDIGVGTGLDSALTPSYDYDGLSGQARHYLDMEEKQIDSTRLDYTTVGLKDKREIALTVPSVEGWRDNDTIHFGDADNGTAVAWARFGETITAPNPELSKVVIEKFGLVQNFLTQMEDKYGSYDWNLVKRQLTPEEQQEWKLLTREHEAAVAASNASKERVLVIDEIQSKRHQEGRKHGYKQVLSPEQQLNLLEAERGFSVAYSSFSDYKRLLEDKYGDVKQYLSSGPKYDPSVKATDAWKANLSADELSEYNSLKDNQNQLLSRLQDLKEQYGMYDQRVPGAPFEKNWHELTMKRMLRYAAENGYDRVAWLNGLQQSERYSIGGKVESIFINHAKDHEGDIVPKYSVTVFDHLGNVIDGVSPNAATEEEVRELFGKGIGDQLFDGLRDLDRRKALGEAFKSDSFSLQGQDLEVGGEGMKAFYDKMLPDFMNKYGKQWGVHVEDVSIPNIGSNSAGLTLHSVRVNDQMRRDVMNGQPMFFRSGEHQAYGFVFDGTVYIDPRIATAETPLHEYTHLWAEVLRQRNPQEWQNIVQMMKDTPDVWDYVKEYYPTLRTDDEIADEALAQFSGKRGYQRLQEFVDGRQDADTIFGKMMEILEKFWHSVADFFGIHYTSKEEVADRILFDLLNEVNPLDYKIDEVNGLREQQEPQIDSEPFKVWFGDWGKARWQNQINLEKMQDLYDSFKRALPKMSKNAASVYDDFVFDMEQKYGDNWLEQLTDEERQEEQNLLYERDKFDLNENDVDELAFELLHDQYDKRLLALVGHSNGQLYQLYDDDELLSSKVVDSDGKPLVVEHATNNTFYAFDINRLGENSKDKGMFGAGFYFGTHAPGWMSGAKHVMKVYLDMKHPFELAEDMSVADDNIHDYFVKHFDIPALRDVVMKDGGYQITIGEYIDNIKQVDAEIAQGLHAEAFANDEYVQTFHPKDRAQLFREHLIHQRCGVPLIGSLSYLIGTEIGSEQFTQALKKAGYDGVIVDRGNDYKEYVVFESNQIKSATENIGLFNKQNDDIRYQKVTDGRLRRMSPQVREAGGAMIDQLHKMGIGVHTDIQENRQMLKQASQDQSEVGKVRRFNTLSGNNYGFAYKGELYLDPRKIDAELPLHEYAHLWCEAMRRINPENWSNVVAIMKNDADTWNYVKRTYPELSDEHDLAEEVIAHYSGKRGAEKLQQELERMTQRDSSYSGKWSNIFQNINKAIQDFWKHVGDSLNIQFESKEDIADQILKDFVNQVNPVKKVDYWLQSRDKEYADAVAAGDIDKARNMFFDAMKEHVGNGVTPFMSVGGYRGKYDQLARDIKDENHFDAIDKAAYLMAPYIRAGMVLVPAPGHKGYATDTLALANAISVCSFAPVADVLKSDPRERQYDVKKATGKAMTAEQLGIYLKGKLPEDRLPVVIDNVIHTGNTAEACVKALGKGVVLTLASAVSQDRHVSSLKSLAPVLYDKENRLIPLSKRFELKNKYLGKVMYYRPLDDATTLQGFEDYDLDILKTTVGEDIEEILMEAGLSDDVTIKEITFIGSRTRGEAREDSDLDILIEYDGEIKEDALFNILHENSLSYEGIPVDFNPINPHYSLTTDQWLARDAQWRAEDQLKQINSNSMEILDIKDNLKQLLQELLPHDGASFEFVTEHEYGSIAVRALQRSDDGYLIGKEGEGFFDVRTLLYTEQDDLYKHIREQQLANLIGDGKALAFKEPLIFENWSEGGGNQATVDAITSRNGVLEFKGTTKTDVSEVPLELSAFTVDSMDQLYNQVVDRLKYDRLETPYTKVMLYYLQNIRQFNDEQKAMFKELDRASTPEALSRWSDGILNGHVLDKVEGLDNSVREDVVALATAIDQSEDLSLLIDGLQSIDAVNEERLNVLLSGVRLHAENEPYEVLLMKNGRGMSIIGEHANTVSDIAGWKPSIVKRTDGTEVPMLHINGDGYELLTEKDLNLRVVNSPVSLYPFLLQHDHVISNALSTIDNTVSVVKQTSVRIATDNSLVIGDFKAKSLDFHPTRLDAIDDNGEKLLIRDIPSNYYHPEGTLVVADYINGHRETIENALMMAQPLDLGVYDSADEMPTVYEDYTLQKQQYPDEVLLFRQKGFVEAFGQDAEQMSKAFNIPLYTRRIDNQQVPFAMMDMNDYLSLFDDAEIDVHLADPEAVDTRQSISKSLVRMHEQIAVDADRQGLAAEIIPLLEDRYGIRLVDQHTLAQISDVIALDDADTARYAAMVGPAAMSQRSDFVLEMADKHFGEVIRISQRPMKEFERVMQLYKENGIDNTAFVLDAPVERQLDNGGVERYNAVSVDPPYIMLYQSMDDAQLSLSPFMLSDLQPEQQTVVLNDLTKNFERNLVAREEKMYHIVIGEDNLPGGVEGEYHVDFGDNINYVSFQEMQKIAEEMGGKARVTAGHEWADFYTQDAAERFANKVVGLNADRIEESRQRLAEEKALKAIGYPFGGKNADGSFNIPTVDESLYWRYAAGLITMKDAAREFAKSGWTNFVDEDYTKQKFVELNVKYGKLDADLKPVVGIEQFKEQLSELLPESGIDFVQATGKPLDVVNDTATGETLKVNSVGIRHGELQLIGDGVGEDLKLYMKPAGYNNLLESVRSYVQELDKLDKFDQPIEHINVTVLNLPEQRMTVDVYDIRDNHHAYDVTEGVIQGGMWSNPEGKTFNLDFLKGTTLEEQFGDQLADKIQGMDMSGKIVTPDIPKNAEFLNDFEHMQERYELIEKIDGQLEQLLPEVGDLLKLNEPFSVVGAYRLDPKAQIDVKEISRQISVDYDRDVFVCGDGSAGINTHRLYSFPLTMLSEKLDAKAYTLPVLPESVQMQAFDGHLSRLKGALASVRGDESMLLARQLDDLLSDEKKITVPQTPTEMRRLFSKLLSDVNSNEESKSYIRQDWNKLQELSGGSLRQVAWAVANKLTDDELVTSLKAERYYAFGQEVPQETIDELRADGETDFSTEHLETLLYYEAKDNDVPMESVDTVLAESQVRLRNILDEARVDLGDRFDIDSVDFSTKDGAHLSVQQVFYDAFDKEFFCKHHNIEINWPFVEVTNNYSTVLDFSFAIREAQLLKLMGDDNEIRLGEGLKVSGDSDNPEPDIVDAIKIDEKGKLNIVGRRFGGEQSFDYGDGLTLDAYDELYKYVKEMRQQQQQAPKEKKVPFANLDYSKYVLPEGVEVKNKKVTRVPPKEGERYAKYVISADANGKHFSREMYSNDIKAFYEKDANGKRTGRATLDQLVAKYFGKQFAESMAIGSVQEAEHVRAEQAEAKERIAEEKKQKAQVQQNEEQKAAEKSAQEKKAAEEAERKKEEEVRKAEKKDKVPAIVLQSTLLLVALQSAREQGDGVWLNKSGKSAPELLQKGQVVSPFNGLMMALHSDAKGYCTNTYTTFNEAKKDGYSVKGGESGLPFNWYNWDKYVNKFNPNEVITKDAYNALDPEEKELFKVLCTKEERSVFNVDQTSMSDVKAEDYQNLLSQQGTSLQTSVEDAGEKQPTPIEQLAFLREKHPDALFLFRCGDFYETYQGDAEKAAKILGITLTESTTIKDADGKGMKLAMFPYHALDTYLPKLVRSGERIAICDEITDMKNQKRYGAAEAIYDKGRSLVNSLMKQEKVYLDPLSPSDYDAKEDVLNFNDRHSAVAGKEVASAIRRVNDDFRAAVAYTGAESRLNRLSQSSLLPADVQKYDKLVQELASGVLMSRAGLPAQLSKEGMKLVPYWKRELTESPKLMNRIERDVNNAVDVLEKIKNGEQVDYAAIRGEKSIEAMRPKFFTIASDLATIPDIETKSVVIVKDEKNKTAAVILPAGASLEVNNEVSGMNKNRFVIALHKQGFENVQFYNAGGQLGLNQSNEFFADKTVEVAKLKQYQLVVTQKLDLTEEIERTSKVEIEQVTMTRDDKGHSVLYVKPADAEAFTVYPEPSDVKLFFTNLRTQEFDTVRVQLGQKYYGLVLRHPDLKANVLMPEVNVKDLSRISHVNITKDPHKENTTVIFATIDGERQKPKELDKYQTQRFWLVEDQEMFKLSLAAKLFEDKLRLGDGQSEDGQTQFRDHHEGPGVDHDASSSETVSEGQEESEGQNASRLHR